VIILRERLGPWRILALIKVFGGVLVIGFDPAVFRQRPTLLLVVTAALAMAVGTIMMRRVHSIFVYGMQAWLSLLSWPPLLLASLVLDGFPLGPVLDMSGPLVAAIAWMAVGVGLIGQATYYWTMQRHQVGLTAPFMLLAPILGAAGAVPFLEATISWRIMAGSILTLAGVLLIALRKSRLPTPRA
jgi:O-acetylserine/cysteine efflux transporter